MDAAETRRRMEEGRLYSPEDESILKEQTQCLLQLYRFNMTRPDEPEKRKELLSEMFAEIGEGCYIEPPLRANWGGRHVHFGKNVYANFNLTLVDDGHIYVGDAVMFGPNVTVATAGHPVEPQLRSRAVQFNIDVHIGQNVWIGAGSVVTKDIPADVVAAGNPCRVLREIGGHDRLYYYKNRPIDLTVEDIRKD